MERFSCHKPEKKTNKEREKRYVEVIMYVDCGENNDIFPLAFFGNN